ncbi:glycosyltransferase family 1 protein [uncultured Bacteroides sp.]|uniref:glycosyltransferase family 1 protein n=1 Tax=uncultured Bacteroides sp. TaxID=162156 RepID=UPI002AAB117C|nr:glycosyltransferase family 1 protein [uncultured Bacteroides sp.]
MKILFLVFHGFSESSGISKKIVNQVIGLRNNGHQVDLCHYDILPNGHRCRMINDEILKDYGCGKLASLKKRICYNAIYKYIVEHNIQMVYMRSNHNANPFTIHFMHKLKSQRIKVVMEIPTYPYDQEYKGFSFKDQLELKMDQLFRRSLVHELFRICTFSDCESIFGTKTIKISNGIDFDSTPIKKFLRKNPNSFNLIGVAEVHYWHGFDRVIAGIGEYYQQKHDRDVFFHIVGGVGEESEMPVFKEIIERYGIEKQIIFHGQLFGKALDDIFEDSDFGIASLGRHRSGITNIKTLKNREYAARGIPFIYSEIDDDFDGMPYILKAPADDSPTDIKILINFFYDLNISPTKIRNSVQHLSWTNQMNKVLIETSDEQNCLHNNFS